MNSNNSSNNDDDDSRDDDTVSSAPDDGNAHDDDYLKGPVYGSAINSLHAWCAARARENVLASLPASGVTESSNDDNNGGTIESSADIDGGNSKYMLRQANRFIVGLRWWPGLDDDKDARELIPVVIHNNSLLDELASPWSSCLSETLDDLKRTNHDLFSFASASPEDTVADAVKRTCGPGRESDERKMIPIDAALSDDESELHGILNENITRASRRMLSCHADLAVIRSIMTSANEYYLNKIADWSQSRTMMTGVRTPNADAAYNTQIKFMTSAVRSTIDDATALESECRKYISLLVMNEENARMRHLLRMAPIAYPECIDDETVDGIITGVVDPSVITAGSDADSAHSDGDNAPNAGITLDAVRMLSDDSTRGMEESRLKITEGWRGLAGSSRPATDSLDNATWLRWSVDGFTDGIDAMRQHDALTSALSTLTGINA